jgi:hypothetical protein
MKPVQDLSFSRRFEFIMVFWIVAPRGLLAVGCTNVSGEDNVSIFRVEVDCCITRRLHGATYQKTTI